MSTAIEAGGDVLQWTANRLVELIPDIVVYRCLFRDTGREYLRVVDMRSGVDEPIFFGVSVSAAVANIRRKRARHAVEARLVATNWSQSGVL